RVPDDHARHGRSRAGLCPRHPTGGAVRRSRTRRHRRPGEHDRHRDPGALVTSRIGVAAIGLCLILYFVLTGQRAFLFLISGEPVGVAMGAALIVLPLIGVWALVREIQFGVQAERLGAQLDAEGGMPVAETELTPSGRLAKADAAPLLQRYAAEVESAADDW